VISATSTPATPRLNATPPAETCRRIGSLGFVGELRFVMG
jgi:hypothetical protein